MPRNGEKKVSGKKSGGGSGRKGRIRGDLMKAKKKGPHGRGSAKNPQRGRA